MVLCNDRNDLQVMQSLMASLVTLTVENKLLKQDREEKSTLIKEQKMLLSRACKKNKETQQELDELQHLLVKKEHDLQHVMIAGERREATFEKWQREVCEQNANLAFFLNELTLMLKSLQNEAEQAASALEKALVHMHVDMAEAFWLNLLHKSKDVDVPTLLPKSSMLTMLKCALASQLQTVAETKTSTCFHKQAKVCPQTFLLSSPPPPPPIWGQGYRALSAC
jgi:hypothetical protein